ncbi:unnamed protein product [Ectocarpus sp. CCAP 1310/34]|nr:unnamed protein product [Ectocarpus sp. CCAP 1310/34]
MKRSLTEKSIRLAMLMQAVAAPPVSSPADEFTDEGEQGGPESGEVESAGPGG